MAHPELGSKILDQVLTQIGPLGKVEASARLEGRNMTMVLSPDKKAADLADKKAADEAAEAEAEAAARAALLAQDAAQDAAAAAAEAAPPAEEAPAPVAEAEPEPGDQPNDPA